MFVHRSPIIYKHPEEFLPERWLGPEAKACETALSVFSKGPRSCFGVNLAYIEMYMELAHLFRTFELQIDESRCVFIFLGSKKQKNLNVSAFYGNLGQQI